jgi:hypothetical protein
MTFALTALHFFIKNFLLVFLTLLEKILAVCVYFIKILGFIETKQISDKRLLLKYLDKYYKI